MCQFFLADGVSEWLLRDRVPHEKEYGPSFVRKWLRRAFESFESYSLVTSNWSAYYHSGLMGFPEDKSLYLCWREVANSNNDMSRDAVLDRAETCRNLEISKYGKDAEWLSE